MKSARTLITIWLLLTAITLFAQTTPSQLLMKVNVPFSFDVEGHYLPAGKYEIFTVTPEREIRLVSADGKQSAIVDTLPNYASTPSANSRVVFHRYGDEYFLAQIWTAGQNVARNPLSSKRAIALANSGERNQTFTVLALADRR